MNSFKHPALIFVILVSALSGTVASADSLVGVSSFLCSPGQVTACPLDEPCTTGSPWKFDVPRFIAFDLVAKTLSTTAASGLNRSTSIKNLTRENGLIILQGAELGRAFSFVINEATGVVSISVALDGKGVVGFGACTPTPVK